MPVTADGFRIRVHIATMIETPRPWHPLRRLGCGLRGGVGFLLVIAIGVGLTLLLLDELYRHNLTDSDDNCTASPHHVGKRSVVQIGNMTSMLENNVWYRAMLTMARKLTNGSCYVCAELPHELGNSLPLKPYPLNVSETLGAMIAFTQGVHSPNSPNRTVRHLAAALEKINVSTVNYEGATVRFWNVIFLQGIYQPVMSTNPTSQKGTVCFFRECATSKDHFLGTSACTQVVEATCGVMWTHSMKDCKGASPYVATLNLTDTVSLNRSGIDNPAVYMPSSDGYGSLRQHVWVCGRHVYQALQPGWCDRCYLAKLLPAVTILPDLTHFHTHYDHYYPPHKAKRGVVRVPPLEKGFGGFLPWWGTVNNAHKIDAIAMDLENLTDSMATGFSALTPTLQGLRNVALQNRMALDLILASQGGVCHIVGTDCCTYIPDITDNMTHVVAHLNDLLHLQKSRDNEVGTGADLWSWFSLTGWKATLMHLFAPVIPVLLLLCLFLCCIVPCVKSLITSMISSAVGRYVQMDPMQDLWIPPYDSQESLF